MGKLDGKVALVTGGNSGIGLAAAKRLADVVIRVQTHPASRIEELLPHWAECQREPST